MWSFGDIGNIGLVGAPVGVPASLFFAGEKGVWFDPSDFSTMYQDSAGTTPVTAVTQPVGLILDKSQGLAIGPEVVVNGGFSTGDFTGWTHPDTAPSITEIINNAARMTAAPGGTLARLRQSITLTPGFYRVTLSVSGITGTPGAALALGNASSGDTTYGNLPLLTNGQYRIIVNVVGTFLGLAFTAGSVTGGTITIDDVSVKAIAGNHASQSTSANRPVLQQDAGGNYYLAFNGTSSSLATVAIDFTATDKMTVWAGVRKLSDAAAGMILELSSTVNTNNGSFNIDGPETGATYGVHVRGTVAAGGYNHATFTAPITNVISTQLDTAGVLVSDQVKSRFNGILNTTGSVGTTTIGNFGNYPLYIGARAGTSVFFNGNLYQLIVRGAASNSAQITNTENYVNTKTGAY